jgi:predicted RNase H-like HicB family nuclease
MLISEYKGYEGIFEYDQDSESFFGNAVATRYRSAITFQGETPKEAVKNFQEAVDKHLDLLSKQQKNVADSQDLNPQAIASIIEDIKYKLAGVTQGPWRWANWETNFGSREEEGLENKRVLEYSASRGDSRGSEIHEIGDEAIKVLEVEEPLDNEQDAYFIVDSRRDIETLVVIAEFLLNENQKLKTKEPPV